MRGLTVAVRQAMVALAISGLGTGLVAGCAGTRHADKPETASSVSVSPAARHVSSPRAPSHSPESRAAARHSRLPGVYLGLGAGPWYGPTVRPRDLYFGADWSFVRIRWTDWGRRHADGRGLYMESPDAGGPLTKYWAGIRVTQVRKHHGHRYFAIMKLTRGNGRVLWLAMDNSYGVWRWRG